ncbi:MAG: DUF1284 domain-containing protein [Methanobrevibacter sp.]|jgi:hypothetical protein|nr:DUF1284 domain-containing protein [Candidatus Methanovirga meridionalis]
MFDLNKPVKLRAHHLLCLQGYQGYGYSESFKINFENLIDHLKTNPDIVILKSVDFICFHCPNLKDEKCCLNLEKYDENLGKEKIVNKNKEIVEMDLNVIKKTGIIENKLYKIDDLYGIVNNSLNVDDLKDICGKCMWIKKCLWYQSKL